MSRRARTLMLVVLVACGVAIVVPAHAASPIQTHVTLDNSVSLGGGAYTVYGTVSSSNHKCVAGRTVRVYRKPADEPKILLDIDKTGKSGRYAGTGEFKISDVVIAKVARRKIGPRKHRRVCGGASISAD